VSLEEWARELKAPPEVHSGFDVGVQWQDASGRWLVTVTEPFRTPAGAFELGPVWQGHYSDLEASTGYQALMLGLSDWRNRG
jgi:hypothetical protein